MVRAIIILSAFVTPTTSIMMAGPQAPPAASPGIATSPAACPPSLKATTPTQGKKSSTGSTAKEQIVQTGPQKEEEAPIPAPGSYIQRWPSPEEIQTCVNGRCNQYGGLHVDPSDFPRAAGTFTIVTTPQGTIRINSVNGAASLLCLAPDGKSAEWKRITEGSPSAGDQFPFDIGANAPIAAPIASEPPKASK